MVVFHGASKLLNPKTLNPSLRTMHIQRTGTNPVERESLGQKHHKSGGFSGLYREYVVNM